MRPLVRHGGATKPLRGIRVKLAGQVLPVKRIAVRQGGQTRFISLATTPLEVEAAGDGGTGTGITGATVETLGTFADATGGRAPYAYIWAILVNGGGTASAATAPTSANTAFRKTGMAQGQVSTDRWRVTVTDADDMTASADIDVLFDNQRQGFPGGGGGGDVLV